MAYWLMKTEPDVYSIEDLKSDKTTYWDGVRNYQARNFMKDMKVGDLVLVYHSNASPPGIAGIAKISKAAYPDPTQFDKRSKYYDPKSSKEEPRWFCPELRFVKKLKTFVSLPMLRETKSLADMLVLKKGSRLSVQPVEEKHFKVVEKLGAA